MLLIAPQMTRVEALNALRAINANGTPYEAARGFSVTADACFFFWEDELEKVDANNWIVKRVWDQGLDAWAIQRQGAVFYQKLLVAQTEGTLVRVALNRIARHDQNGGRVAGGGALPILFADNSPAYGKVVHLEMRDHSVEIAFSASLGKPPRELHAVDEVFNDEVKSSSALSQEDRLALIRRAHPMPATARVLTTIYVRNPNVVAEALFRARGLCGSCTAMAPFTRKTTGEPYLEVHHKIPLAAGGEDTLENVIALCPNCHRKAHYG